MSEERGKIKFMIHETDGLFVAVIGHPGILRDYWGEACDTKAEALVSALNKLSTALIDGN